MIEKKDALGYILHIFHEQQVLKIMKVRASVKADPSKGDVIVRRKGRIYVLNKKDPTRKQRQKGVARKRSGRRM